MLSILHRRCLAKSTDHIKYPSLRSQAIDSKIPIFSDLHDSSPCGSGAGGRRFESSRPDHFKSIRIKQMRRFRLDHLLFLCSGCSRFCGAQSGRCQRPDRRLPERRERMAIAAALSERAKPVAADHRRRELRSARPSFGPYGYGDSPRRRALWCLSLFPCFTTGNLRPRLSPNSSRRLRSSRAQRARILSCWKRAVFAPAAQTTQLP